MKKMTRYIGMAALALVGTVMMGCAESDLVANNNQQPKGNTVTLTSTISLDNSAGTRALGADGKKTFAKDDQIAILYKDANDKSQKVIATLKDTDISGDGKTAKITITLNSPKASGQLRCIYPAVMLSGDFDPNLNPNPDINDENTINIPSLSNYQDGTLATIASKYDLAVFDGTFTSDAELPGSIALKNRLAIVAFTIKDYDGNDITSTITNLEIEQGHGLFSYSVNREAAAGPIYVAMMPSENANEKITITATDGTTTLEKTARDVTLAASNIYPVTVTLLDMLHTPLTLEATEDGTTVTITDASNVEYSYTVNGGTAVTTSTNATITLQAGDIVQFNSTNSALGKNIASHDPSVIDALTIIVDKKSYVYGNVMSMVNDAGDFATDVTLADYAMPRLFSGKSSNHIAFLADKPLMLPATTISKYCYGGMFSYCIELTALPSGFLPATVMQEGCYRFMFDHCKGLTSLPDDLLPATTLAKECYVDMFQGCNGLTTLPDDLLPATMLADKCYRSMFHLCTELTHAPILRAPTLVEECYERMFAGCNNLSEVTCLATNISATDCLNGWLSSAGSIVSGPKKLYVDPTMINDGNWQLDTSGEDGKRWTTVAITE